MYVYIYICIYMYVYIERERVDHIPSFDSQDWQRLSSMMLLPTFWRSTLGQKVLIFQPDSAMCAQVSI